MSQRSSVHQPVMLREVLRFLDLKPDLIVVDGTVGAGGHSAGILDAIGSGGLLLGLDRDEMMLALAAERLRHGNCRLIHDSYAGIREQLDTLGIDAVDRVLVDLGLSSDQLADRSRGFGFQAGGPLDLRFDTSQGRPAAEVLRSISESDLVELLDDFGEERFSREIAAELVQRRRTRPVATTEDLTEAVEEAIPARFQRSAKKHPATRVLQALRIAVNDELQHLQRSLDEVFFDALRPGGRLVVLSFHSIEDRMVKQTFQRRDRWQALTTKPVQASPAELRMNPRTRSAKLRAATRM